MTPNLEFDRKRKKRADAMSTAMMLATIGAIVAGASWIEYVMLDFVEPWVRIAGIALAWIATAGMLVLAVAFQGRKQHRTVPAGKSE